MDSQVEEIKSKVTIHEVVGGYVQLQRAGRNFRARCPFHRERTPSFMVSPERGTYMCFGCSEHGDIFSFVQKIEGIDFPTALRQLAERAGVVLVSRGSRDYAASRNTPEVKEKEERLRDVCEAATAFFESTLAGRKDVQDYLTTRGVSAETIKTWRLGYAPASWEELCKHLLSNGFSKDDIVEAGFGVKSERKPGEVFDRFRGRIMFPIFDASSKVIAVSGRFFEKVLGAKDDSEPAKYVNSPETPLFKKSRVLYGYDRAKNAIRKLDCILLVEGQFDLILCHQSGLPFTVALSGTALTHEHLSLLSRLSKRLVLALDADAAGLRSGIKSAAMALALGFDVKVPTFLAGQDPADLARENPELLKAAVRTSKTAIEFFLDAVRGTLPAGRQGDERAYKKIVETQILPLVAALPSKIEQEHFVRIVAERLRVPEDAIRAEVAKRPALPADDVAATKDSPLQEVAPTQTPSQLERAAGLVLFHFPKTHHTHERLVVLLGDTRLQALQEKLAPDAERLRFEFESLGDDEALTGEALLEAVERAVIEEEILTVRDALRGDAGVSSELTQKLSLLKRREQELRK
ncbi:MAG: DNA primase [bacterium]|nr:DNA primase [bacterium]